MDFSNISKHFILFYMICFLIGVCCLTLIFIVSGKAKNEFLKKLRNFILLYTIFILSGFAEYYKTYFFSEWGMNLLITCMNDVVFLLFFYGWLRLIDQVVSNDKVKKFNFIVLSVGIIGTIIWIYTDFNYVDANWRIVNPLFDQLTSFFDFLFCLLLFAENLYFGNFLLRSAHNNRKKRYLFSIIILMSIYQLWCIADIVCFFYLPSVSAAMCSLYPFDPCIGCYMITCLFTSVYLWQDGFLNQPVIADMEIPAEQYSLDQISEKHSLTRREKEIIELVSRGYSNPEISEMLNISTSTVKRHMQNIFKKMNIKNRFELIYMIKADQN